MFASFVRMCTTRFKRLYTLLVMFITASLILYAVTSIGKDGDKIENHDDVLNNRRRGEDFLEALEKVKERVVKEDDLTNDEEAGDAKDLDKKLFEDNEATEEVRKVGGIDEAEGAGCDACGETDEEVALPFTPTPKTKNETLVVVKTVNQTRIVNKFDLDNRDGRESPLLTAAASNNSDKSLSNRRVSETKERFSRSPKKSRIDENSKSQIADEKEKERAVVRIKREQERRKSRVEQACKVSPYLKYQNLLYRDTLNHLYVIDSQKLLFCYIPKVGCSNWKRLLMVLSGRRHAIDGITSREAHAHNGLTRFGSLSMSQQLQRLYSYKKVMFVREPFTRIISAFKNKYQDLSVFHAAPDYLKQYAKRIMKKYRANATTEDLVTGENITWAEFTDYLADPSERPQFDEHWKESFKLCSPCKIKYDFIGKLENMEEEANFVLQNFNFTKELKYPSSNNSHPTGSAATNISNYFKDFSQAKIQTLWSIYKTDYALFGYTPPSFVH